MMQPIAPNEEDLKLIGWQWIGGLMPRFDADPGMWSAWLEHANTLHSGLTDSHLAREMRLFVERYKA
jgi:hypothetical protein